jgi:hypothetical protein
MKSVNNHISRITAQDYSEALLNIQLLLKKLQEEMRNGNYTEGRDISRDIAVEAMFIGIWCKEAVDKNNKTE